ncbi:hypothetical protein Nepgr_015160 [Nepenthes gracilis]|uniref:PNPLA domain-containing protein n=1 Tax=Nepenthes gracilis TaxID=150966 RepID=A0AAD3XQV4_NEPGR|nr:hypothetical protein Nepgr_015160 [Nepenthes gracilis]
MPETSIDTNKLSYEIFSILERKFLFGYDDYKVWLPKQISPCFYPNIEFTPSATLLMSTPSPDNSVNSIKNQRGKVCILSLDGSDMRNILTGMALAYLDHALKEKSGTSDARITDYFDVATGTGIGGIFTATLFATNDNSRPIFRAEDTWRFLAEQGKKIYRSGSGGGAVILKRILKRGGSIGTTTAGLEELMKEVFTKSGRSLTLNDTMKPVQIACYDMSSTAPFLFSPAGARADEPGTDNFDLRLCEVSRVMSAELGVSEPVNMLSTDGATKCVTINRGRAMSNPTAAAIMQVMHDKEFLVRGVEDILVLSLGMSQHLEGSYGYEQVRGWKANQWAGPRPHIAGDGHSDTVDQAVAMTFGYCCSNMYVLIQVSTYY